MERRGWWKGRKGAEFQAKGEGMMTKSSKSISNAGLE